MVEGNWEKMKLNVPRKQKSERQNDWQCSGHTVHALNRQTYVYSVGKGPDARTIRPSHKIRSVSTGTQWSGPMKSCIACEFLPSHRTESDRGSGP